VLCPEITGNYWGCVLQDSWHKVEAHCDADKEPNKEPNEAADLETDKEPNKETNKEPENQSQILKTWHPVLWVLLWNKMVDGQCFQLEGIKMEYCLETR
jgi:hypothetical protein